MSEPTRTSDAAYDFLRLRAEALLELFDERPSSYDDPLQARLDGLREALGATIVSAPAEPYAFSHPRSPEEVVLDEAVARVPERSDAD